MWMSKYFPKPKFLGENVKIELNLSSHATKADLKNWARVHTLDFAWETDFANLKSNAYKIDIDKLKNIPYKCKKFET